ncbi:extracellular solute-binding protein [Metabacillus malikii]|uniref:Arabinogalactan oligomer/maltooligosaccharide transport system substrate-binding protein n=1 Tax=Metabacillus malikii TaxID=1504265 RepID=A0ABT9ZM37_9BACI|nr:extracellular solute-binding protein [Metabacillus malikii]MDQ0232265.1 arabinogalactan oligomer/maltooligosaccharide transport system substrate-binding protein [Metabacillus malikii]
MKKILTLLMMAVLFLGVLAACGPDSSKESGSSSGSKSDDKGKTTEGEMPEKPEKLVVWEDTDRGVALEPAIESFEKEYGIEVEYKELGMSDEIRDQLRLDGPAGTGPDVVTLPHDQIGQVVTEGLIAELNVEQEVLDTYTETSVSAQQFEGKLYGLPKAMETPIFLYNKAHMSEAPKTMEEVYTFAKDFTKDSNFGFLFLGDNYYFSHGLIGGYGGYVFKEANGALDPKDVGLNNEGAVQGAEEIQKWYTEGLFPKGIIGENGGSTMDGLFNEGKVAAVMNGPWAVQGMKDAGIDVGAAALPTLSNGEHVKTFIGVKGWHVSAFSKNTEWATKLVEHITNAENAKLRFELTNEVPPVKELIEDPIIKDNEVATAVAEQSQYAVPTPNTPEMAEVWEPMADSLQTIVTGKAEPKAALDSAVKTINQNIETNHKK